MDKRSQHPPNKRQHLALMRPGFEQALKEEFLTRFGFNAEVACRAGVSLPENIVLPGILSTIFVRQYLPRALRFRDQDHDSCLKSLCDRMDVMISRSNRQQGNWTLHAFAIDDDDQLRRARKLSKGLLDHLQKKHREFFQRFTPKDEFAAKPRNPSDFICQIYCPAEDDLWFSTARVDEGISLYEAGFRPMRSLKHAPSRSASKLEEALSVLGRHPSPGDTAVDLGAAPGGWSMVLARHGAIVEAVDHAELKLDPKLKLKGQINHIKANGLKYMPKEPVDWLVCDMVMGAKDTLEILKKWALGGTMQNFVVNVKLPKDTPWAGALKALEAAEIMSDFTIITRQLLHDRSEITLMGFKKARSF
jgi:23S rRNA C2498 (ribose-2'-O)-methylase RlmM